MRRLAAAAMFALALAGALAVGPLGVTAAAPYVYGCTPVTLNEANDVYTVQLWIYNGSATTAHITHKLLAGNGTLLNATFGVPITSTLKATHTLVRGFPAPGTNAGQPNGTVPAAFRIVSNVPVSVTLSSDFHGDLDWKSIACTPQQP
jgi:hypothetical protein